jgi:nicotinamide riboside kinase
MTHAGAVYLIGPSSVGKSYLAEQVGSSVGVPVRDMSKELSTDGRDGERIRDWDIVAAWLEQADGDRSIVPVDARIQDWFSDELTTFLTGRSDRVVVVTDDAWLAFVRDVEAGNRAIGQFASYFRSQYREREGLYGTAGHRVDYRAVKKTGAPAALEGIVRELLASD